MAIDDEADMHRLLSFGVDGIIMTDRPDVTCCPGSSVASQAKSLVDRAATAFCVVLGPMFNHSGMDTPRRGLLTSVPLASPKYAPVELSARLAQCRYGFLSMC